MFAERIVSIKELDEQETFDLQVIKNHNFILDNGIVTHNSGKSFQMLYIAERLAAFMKKELKIENVAFTITDMLNLIESSKHEEIYLLDEQIASVGCLSGDTIVQNKDGKPIKISQLKDGQKVMAWDWGKKIIDSVSVTEAGLCNTIRVETESGALEGTGEHPVWVERKGNFELENINSLRIGDKILKMDI